MIGVRTYSRGGQDDGSNRTGFATACREAMTAVLDALAAVGEERRRLLTDSKLAIGTALHDAHSSEEWYLADQLRRGIKDVEARVQDAA
jgi:hypothetical protein